MARRYVRDRKGRFATVGATARGGRLTTEKGKRYATEKKGISGAAPKGTISKTAKRKPAAPAKGGAVVRRGAAAPQKPTGATAAKKPAAKAAAGTISGSQFADGKARKVESLADTKRIVGDAVKKSGLEPNDFYLAAGVTKLNSKGLEVGRPPKTAAEWQQVRRSMVGVPEHERGLASRPGVIRGIDIHQNFRPAYVFDLKPGYTKADVEASYRKLSKQVHPDLGGRREDFEKIKSMRDSLVATLEMSQPSKPKRRKR